MGFIGNHGKCLETQKPILKSLLHSRKHSKKKTTNKRKKLINPCNTRTTQKPGNTTGTTQKSLQHQQDPLKNNPRGRSGKHINVDAHQQSMNSPAVQCTPLKTPWGTAGTTQDSLERRGNHTTPLGAAGTPGETEDYHVHRYDFQLNKMPHTLNSADAVYYLRLRDCLAWLAG